MSRAPGPLALVALAATTVGATAQPPPREAGHFADVNGVRIYYEDRGQGEPLFLLHNFFNTASGWDGYTDALASDRRVIAWDMRGHGRSSNPSTADIFLHEDVAKDLLGLMDHLGIGQASAIGASSGGMALLYAATIAPERFDTVVLVGVPTYRSSQARGQIDGFLQSLEADPGLRGQFLLAHGEAGTRRLLQQFKRFKTVYGDPAFTPDILSTISADVLIIQGDNDPYHPTSQPLQMFSAILNARLWIVPNGGHLPHLLPYNREDFARRVRDFLADQWGESPR